MSTILKIVNKPLPFFFFFLSNIRRRIFFRFSSFPVEDLIQVERERKKKREEKQGKGAKPSLLISFQSISWGNDLLPTPHCLSVII